MTWLWERIKGGGALVWLLICAVVGMGAVILRGMIGRGNQENLNRALGDSMANARREQEERERELFSVRRRVREALEREQTEHAAKVLNYPDDLNATLRRYNARMGRRQPTKPTD